MILGLCLEQVFIVAHPYLLFCGQTCKCVSCRFNRGLAGRVNDISDSIDLIDHFISGFGIGQIFVITDSSFLSIGQFIIGLSCRLDGRFALRKDHIVDGGDQVYYGNSHLGVGQIFVVADFGFLVTGQRIIVLSCRVDSVFAFGEDRFVNGSDLSYCLISGFGIGQILIVVNDCFPVVSQLIIGLSCRVDLVLAIGGICNRPDGFDLFHDNTGMGFVDLAEQLIRHVCDLRCGNIFVFIHRIRIGDSGREG